MLPATLNPGGTSQDFDGANAAKASFGASAYVTFWRGGIIGAIMVVAAVAMLFATAQGEGQHWYSDAPRHALNGAFVRDFLLQLPLHDPKQWAIDYYLQYPALTILFYPPLFPSLEAVVFLVAGVSTKAALFTVAICYAALGLGALRLFQRWMSPALAAAGAVFFVGLPEIALWGRQVMLDIPVCAFLVWALVWFLRFLDTDRTRDLFTCVALMLAALYTKQTVAFIVPGMLAVYAVARGWRGFTDRRLWIAAALALIGLIPLLILTLKFGQTNIESASGVDYGAVSRNTWRGLTYYLAALPGQIGWVAILLAVIATLALVARPAWRPRRADALLLALWFGVGYLFFWSVDLKAPRFTVPLLLPVAAVIYIALARAVPAKWQLGVGWCLAIASFAYTLAFAPVPVITGYMEAAQWIRANTPPGAVLISAKRDGSFIFNLRSLDPERHYAVLRADKMFLDLAITRDAGVREKDIRREDITPLLTRYGVGYVVAERDFWTDLRPMALLQSVLDSDAFEEVARIPIAGNVKHEDKELRIYRNRAALPEKPAQLGVDLPAIGRHFEGSLPTPSATD